MAPAVNVKLFPERYTSRDTRLFVQDYGMLFPESNAGTRYSSGSGSKVLS